MKLGVKTSKSCVLVSMSKRAYNRNGASGFVHTLGVVSNGESVAEVNCTDLVYDRAAEIGQFSEVVLFGEYDTNYRNFKITGIEPLNLKK